MPPFLASFKSLLWWFPWFSLSVLLVLSFEQGWLHEPMCNVEILHLAQIGQNPYMEYARTIYINKYILYRQCGTRCAHLNNLAMCVLFVWMWVPCVCMCVCHRVCVITCVCVCVCAHCLCYYPLALLPNINAIIVNSSNHMSKLSVSPILLCNSCLSHWNFLHRSSLQVSSCVCTSSVLWCRWQKFSSRVCNHLFRQPGVYPYVMLVGIYDQ